MTTKETRNGIQNLILSMCIFGTVGIFRKHIEMPSSLIALCRAVIGALCLFGVLRLKRKKINWAQIRRYLIPLTLSSVAMAFNWIFLFEAYNYTTVTTATLCYYLAPSIAVVASHFLLKDRLNLRRGICVAVAFCGMVLISGIVGTGMPGPAEIKGILFGLMAAVLYATVMLLNRIIHLKSPYDKTLLQLGISALVLLPYTLLTVDASAVHFSAIGVALLLIVGIVHTGIAYALYFGSAQTLPTRTVALLSYIDPILAIVLSALLLKEPLGIQEIIGSVLILGAAYISERN